MFVHSCVYVCSCVVICVYVGLFVFIRIYMCLCVFMCVYMCFYVCLRVLLCFYFCLCVFMRAHITTVHHSQASGDAGAATVRHGAKEQVSAHAFPLHPTH